MRKPSVLLAWLVFSLVVIFTMSVEAYEFTGRKWSSPTTAFRVDISGARAANFFWNAAFETAMERWNDVTPFEFGIVRDTFEDPCDGLPNLISISSGDYENGVAFTNDVCGDAFGADVIAVATSYVFYGGIITGELVQANIHFNNNRPWYVLPDDPLWDVYDGPWSLNGSRDFRRVAVHELGHVLGLAHEDDVPAIMVTAESHGNTIVTPQCDDIAGVWALYEDANVLCPVNYGFSNATWILGPMGRVTGSNVNATDESWEPGPGSASVWWRWVPPVNGTVTIDTVGSSFDTTLGVYSRDSEVSRAGDDETQMETPHAWAGYTLAENDNAVDLRTRSRVTLGVTGGTDYMLRVAGSGGETGDIVLNWDLQAAGENDRFSDANLISGRSGSRLLHNGNVDATDESGEPVLGRRSVWWQWTAPSNGTATIDTVGSSFDTTLGVYTGTRVDALIALAENDDAAGLHSRSRVTLDVTAGTDYMLRVAGSGGETGDIVLNWDLQAEEANDRFSNATLISGRSGRVTGRNVDATDESGEPEPVLGRRSVWWQWTAPSKGRATIDTVGSGFDTTLGVYTGTRVDALSALAENDDAAGLHSRSRVTLDVRGGTAYMLRVAGAYYATGDIVLNWDLSQAPPQSSESESFSIPNLGGWSVTSDGTEAATKMGYGRIRADAGSTTPSGIAIFGLRQGGVLVSEAGVPATEAVREGRIFAEVNGPVNTGLAIANPNDAPATIDFYFTDTGGNRFGEGRYELRAHEQTATFLNQPPFNSGSPVLGTFTFTSSLPIAVVALRGLTNQADEFLMTTLPVAPLSSAATASTDTVYFPHFADGSGWATEVILVNPTDATITGTVRFLGPGSGAMTASRATLTLDDGRTGSDFAYSIPPRSSQKFTTSNPSRPVSSGSVRAIPNQGSAAPSGLVVFSYTTPGGKTVSESGVSALPAGSAFRVYAELSGTPGRRGSIRTGLAIVNTADTSTTVTLELTELDGTLAAPPATLSLPPSGQVALFLDEIIVSRPGHYSGVLRVTSTADVAVVGLRLRINERGELKMTTTPPSEETGASTTADRFFPHFVDSAGWSTQFILFSGTAGGASSGTLGFIDPQGAPLDLPVAPTETVSPAEVPDLVVENLPVTNSSPNPGESFFLDAKRCATKAMGSLPPQHCAFGARRSRLAIQKSARSPSAACPLPASAIMRLA